jgi:hypothetical protein
VRSRLRSASGVLAAAACAIAMLSAWHSGSHVWRQLDSEYESFRTLTPTERRQAPLTDIQVPGSIFDFYAKYLDPGDRVYFQVLPSGLSSNLTLPQAITAVGRFYLLPAVQTTDLRDATVVVSYFANPALLHVKYLTEVEAGAQPLYVSRLRPP